LSFLAQLKLPETLLRFVTIDSTAFSSSNPHAFQINFNSLYTALCEQQKSDQATLLLYMLLHQNGN
ncbi:DYM protein, partial [Nyctibius grandis]|nr:DYM protein [Nyctibius grandis]